MKDEGRMQNDRIHHPSFIINRLPRIPSIPRFISFLKVHIY
jgi:hypothetical protein